MSSRAQSPITLADFLRLPERSETGKRHELHDGEVVPVPPARPPPHQTAEADRASAGKPRRHAWRCDHDFPYRPAPNLQYWFANVAYVPRADWDAMPPNDYPVYATALIVEVLSPSNTPAKISRQRTVAMSAGTLEFWVVDPEKRTVQVTDPAGIRTYSSEDTIPVALFAGTVSVDQIFAI